jgi:polyisoprenyl-phosphate glycosyltransferase
VVVPCYNEEEALPATHQTLTRVLQSLNAVDFELIYIDDGSSDRSLPILEAIQSGDRQVRVISFTRNFGRQIAVAAGLEHAAGDAAVIIDADLQDPPEVIEEMLELWRGGAQVVYGVRRKREGETLFKIWTAKWFYRVISRFSNIKIPLDTGDFRLIDRKVVDAITAMPERDRFTRGMVTWVGFKQVPLAYTRQARHRGQTKYPFGKMVRFAADGLLSFSMTPLRLAIWMGFATAGLALIGIVYAFFIRLLTDSWVQGWAMLFIAMLFLGGVQLVFLGILGEYIGRIFGEVKQRPLYLVQKRLGFEGDSAGLTRTREKHGV